EVAERFRASAPEDFAALWPHIRDEADHLAHEAERKLAERGVEEAGQLRELLVLQRETLRLELAGKQLSLDFGKTKLSSSDKDQQKQLELDREAWQRRLEEVEREIETEPGQIEELYKVALQRLEPVGMVYLC
ncbi:MAG: helicase, partial [bacterium]|nr:helicase [bacterium]